MKPEERISSYTYFLETSFSLFTVYSLITYPNVAWNELRKFSIFTMQQFNNNSFSHRKDRVSRNWSQLRPVNFPGNGLVSLLYDANFQPACFSHEIF